jgi:uncharacterized membrane protein YdbT with pleckstrin-like domain
VIDSVTVYKTWRSEIKLFILFLLLLIATPYLSNLLPWSVIKGVVWKSSNQTVYLYLPLFWLAPAFCISLATIRIYDVRYKFTDDGIEARLGILSVRQKIVRIRYSDIRSVEIIQSLADRLLGIGMVEISTAASGSIDLRLEGISSPSKIQEIILSRRN